MDKQYNDLGQLVLEADNRLFTQHDFSVLDQLFADDYVEHSPLVAGDKEGLKKLVEGADPNLKHEVSRVLVDSSRNLVALHGAYPGLDPDTVYVGFDIYRVADGKLVEHWDALVAQAAPNQSGHTQLDGSDTPNREADPEHTRAVVEKVWREFLQQQRYEDVLSFTPEDGSFTQHSPDIADGAKEMAQFLQQLKDDNQALTYDTLHRTVADGDFCLTFSEGSIDGKRHFFGELWRVENSRVVELWDAIDEVPADSDLAHNHGVFKSSADTL